MKRKRTFYRPPRKVSYARGVYKFGGAQRTINRARRAAIRRIANMRTAGELGVEVKYSDQSVTERALSQGWANSTHNPAAGSICCPQVGDGATSRDGRKIICKGIHVRGAVYRIRNAGAATEFKKSTVVKVVIVWDRQTNGTALTPTDVYRDNGAADERVYDYRTMEYNTRFRILWSRLFVLYDIAAGNDAAGTFATNGNTIPFEVNLKLNIPVEFIASNGAIGDIVDNSFHILACTTADDATDKLHYSCRARFIG